MVFYEGSIGRFFGRVPFLENAAIMSIDQRNAEKVTI
jgi:hypothetical protein